MTDIQFFVLISLLIGILTMLSFLAWTVSKYLIDKGAHDENDPYITSETIVTMIHGVNNTSGFLTSAGVASLFLICISVVVLTFAMLAGQIDLDSPSNESVVITTPEQARSAGWKFAFNDKGMSYIGPNGKSIEITEPTLEERKQKYR